MLFYISNTFISSDGLKLANNQANAKQDPEAELLTVENYSRSSPTLSNNKNRTYKQKISKNKQKNNCVCIHEIIRLIIMKMRMRIKKR